MSQEELKSKCLKLFRRPESTADRTSSMAYQKTGEQNRRVEEASFSTQLFQKSPLMIAATNLQGTIVNISQAWLQYSGFDSQQIIGNPLGNFLCDQMDVEIPSESLCSPPLDNFSCRMKKRDGATSDILLSTFLAEDPDSGTPCIFGYAIDVSSQLRNEEEIHQLAFYDTLTGLPNRTLFLDRLKQSLAQAVREGQQVAVLFLDLDRFKIVNDTLGHAIGDKLLTCVAQRLRDCVREGDTVARLGGDEFVILLSSPHEQKQGFAMFAERILATLSRPVKISGRELFTTTSIGIAVFPVDGRTVGTLLQKADLAMYAAKDLGRNTYQFFSAEMNVRAQEKHNLEVKLRRALDNGEMHLVYQPIIDLQEGKITGIEALLRWEHSELGSVPPARFLPVAEETGLIFPIGEWVLREACRQARQWQRQGLPKMRIAVNLSGRQFTLPNLVDSIERVLVETGLDPNLLEIELTESILMEGAEETISTLTDLKVRGINLSIDDFGTGYSSLIYLKHFPIHRIKIAQEFVRDIPGDKDDAAIVEAIIGMGHSLNLQVVAEGVETHAQLEFLRDRHCAEMQGYFFGPPMLPEQLVNMFKEGLMQPGVCLISGTTGELKDRKIVQICDS